MKKTPSKSQPIPIAVITGYLGAGKTTLLRNLLEYAQKEKLKLAVVMNEFGQVGIDGKIVKGKNIDLVELSGGCVCCSMSGEFEQALKELLRKAKPDYIVIETTGVAEPDAIVVDLNELNGVELRHVIAVADADALTRFPTLGKTGRMQLEMADWIILNKTDLVDKQQVRQLKQSLAEVNPRATVFQCVRCNFPPDVLFATTAPQEHFKGGKTSEHDHSQNEFFLLKTTKLDMGKFEKFVKSIPKQVYRAKGFVKIASKGARPQTYLWNFVAGNSSLETWNGKQEGSLVFIGEKIGKLEKKLASELAKCELK